MPVNPGRYGYQQNYPDITGDADKLMKSLLDIQDRKNQRARQEELDALNRQIEEQRMAESAAQEVRAAEEAERARQEAEREKVEFDREQRQLDRADKQQEFLRKVYESELKNRQAEAKAREAGVSEKDIKRGAVDVSPADVGRLAEVPTRYSSDFSANTIADEILAPRDLSRADLGPVESQSSLRDVLGGAIDAAQAAAPTEAPLAGLVSTPRPQDFAVDDWTPMTIDEMYKLSMLQAAPDIAVAQAKQRPVRPPTGSWLAQYGEDGAVSGYFNPTTNERRDAPPGTYGSGGRKVDKNEDKSDWVWNNRTNAPEYVKRSKQESAPAGLYSDKVSGRQSAERGVRGEVMGALIAQTDDYIDRYEKGLKGLGRVSSMIPGSKQYRNLDAVRSATGSLAQFFGRTVLGDYRVSDQDRPVYQNAIASLNEIVNMTDPREIRLRWENGKELFNLYNQKFGGSGYQEGEFVIKEIRE